MTIREWELHEGLANATDAVENVTIAINVHLGEIAQSTLVELSDQVRRLRVKLNRLAYAIEAAAPLAELNKQIAQSEAAERLQVQRLRVERQKISRE